jgi:hypothetical protein
MSNLNLNIFAKLPIHYKYSVTQFQINATRDNL